MHKTVRLLFMSIFVLKVLMLSSCTGSADDYYTSGTGKAEVSWIAPTQYTDNITPLEDLAGYIIYYGPATETLAYSVYVDDPGATTFTVENLRIDITYMFAMTALNSDGVESNLSNFVNKIITK